MVEELQALRLRFHRLEPSRPLRDARAAAAFVRNRQIVMESARCSLPSLADAIVGRHIRGSWMADAAVYRIHRIRNSARRYGIVAAPVVEGKETLLIPSLASAVERVARDADRRGRAREHLPPRARRLLDDVEREGEVRMDRWPGPVAAARSARLLLVRELLVWSRSVHTERGYHTAVVVPWSAGSFSQRFSRRAARLPFDQAARMLLQAAIRSAVVAPEREVRRWFVLGPGPLDAMIEEGTVRRLRDGRISWLVEADR